MENPEHLNIFQNLTLSHAKAFPFSIAYWLRITLALLIILVIIVGLKFRLIIIKYMLSQSAKQTADTLISKIEMKHH